MTTTAGYEEFIASVEFSFSSSFEDLNDAGNGQSQNQSDGNDQR
ncbi:MAG: hypothetical protein ACRDLO_11155 [Solirubrobacterales bacterium]